MDVNALIEENKLLKEENTLLRSMLKQLEARVAELEKRLNQNSNNSSKPPSQDGFKRPPKSLRPKGKSKSGGQKGHKGSTLEQVAHPDVIETHSPSHCPTCSKSLARSQVMRAIKRQVFDIVLPRLEVTEHQVEVKRCHHCQHDVKCEFPTDVKAPVQYGHRLQSWAVYLQNEHFIPEERLQSLLYDLLAIPITTATLARFNARTYDNLTEFETTVLDTICQSKVKHMDETGFTIAGKLQWLHVACTEGYTYYATSAGRKALLTPAEHIVVHDHFRSYYKLPNVTHALCNQHHLRELTALIDYDKERWARNMHRFLRLALHYRHRYDSKSIPKLLLSRLNVLYDKIVDAGLTYHESLEPLPMKPKSKSKRRRTGHNLLLRLKDYKEDTLRFLYHHDVPFTNNQAEQDIRMMKVKQKISGGFRSRQGAAIFARIRGFISTARTQQWNIFDAIADVVRGNSSTLV